MERREEQVREEGQVREARRETRFNPDYRYNGYSHDDTDKQRYAKWKVFDVDWEENVISEHEEYWEDISSRDQYLESKSKSNLRNPKQCVVDLSKEVADDRSIFETMQSLGELLALNFPENQSGLGRMSIGVSMWSLNSCRKVSLLQSLRRQRRKIGYSAPKTGSWIAIHYIYNLGLLISILLSWRYMINPYGSVYLISLQNIVATLV
ncbi:hypothetical protein SUGI_0258210 [Cryptomeria japonica]|nr:hypothetical protein SUGI_0258210 [Cryptomeria japonica]